jgi:hypothetical protein
MGNLNNHSTFLNNYNNFEYLKQDWLIDEENKIFIGVVSPKPHTNPYSSQAIRIGDEGKLHRLEKFIETPNSLIFEYESNTSMVLSKRDSDVVINIKEPNTNTQVIKPMDLVAREFFKPINWGNSATEYDKIPEFIRPKFEDIKTEQGRELAASGVICQQQMER